MATHDKKNFNQLLTALGISTENLSAEQIDVLVSNLTKVGKEQAKDGAKLEAQAKLSKYLDEIDAQIKARDEAQKKVEDANEKVQQTRKTLSEHIDSLGIKIDLESRYVYRGERKGGSGTSATLITIEEFKKEIPGTGSIERAKIANILMARHKLSKLAVHKRLDALAIKENGIYNVGGEVRPKYSLSA